MSVTFTSERGDIVGHVISCGCEEAIETAPRYDSFEAAQADLIALNRLVKAGVVTRTAVPGCSMPGICPDYPLYVREIETIERPEIILANANASRVLETLGLPHEFGDLAGEADADEFLGRVLTALAVAPADEGVPFHEMTGVESAAVVHAVFGPAGIPGTRVYECGRRAGYLQLQLEKLHDLATWCASHRRRVCWA